MRYACYMTLEGKRLLVERMDSEMQAVRWVRESKSHYKFSTLIEEDRFAVDSETMEIVPCFATSI